MTDAEVKDGVLKALAQVFSEQPSLDFSYVHERSTAHRLAVHMESSFSGWNIDCEYDKNGTAVKELFGIKGCGLQKKTDRILPDIIVHHRRRQGQENNLLVVELKIDSFHDDCDSKKLQLFTDPYGVYKYQLGLYLNVLASSAECTWYADGIAGEVQTALPQIKLID